MRNFLAMLGMVATLSGAVPLAWAFESPPPPPAPQVKKDNGPKPILVLPPPPGNKTVLPDSDDYKKDKDYQKILQYDLLPYWMDREQKEEGPDLPVHDTIRIHDKAFVLAGEGFQIPQKQIRSGPEFRSNPYKHIDVDLPQPPMIRPSDQIDFSENKVRSQRPLIFRSRHAGYYDLPDEMKDAKPEKIVRRPESPGPISQTRLLMSADHKTELRLERAEQLDLLHRNEKLNRVEFFKNW